MIQTLYSELITVGLSKGLNVGSYIRCDAFDNYSGDSQKIDNNLLSGMFDLLIQIAQTVRKSTSTEPYSTGARYLFDSGWWGLTSDQNTELEDFRKNGYTLNSNRTRTFSQYDSDNYWFLDGTEFKQVEECFGVVSHTGLFNSIPKRIKKDRVRLSSLTNWNSGVFFDPRFRCVETPAELNAWLNECQSILNSIKSLPAVETENYPVSLATVVASDRIRVDIFYFNEPWSDDLTGESGTIVGQNVETSLRKSISTGLMTKKSLTVYSEAKTINIDNGEGGYDQYTYPTTIEGVTFGATAKDVFDLFLSETEQTNTDSTYYFYSATTTDDAEPLGTNYTNEAYEDNTAKNELTTVDDLDVVDNFFTVKNKAPYTVGNYQYIIKYYLNEFSQIVPSNPWESALLVRILSTKEPSLIGNNYLVPKDTVFTPVLGMPVYPFTDIVNGNNNRALWATGSVKLYGDIDTTGATTIILAPPE